MRVPRRLVEDNEQFAGLVDELRRSEPPPKLAADVLQGMASQREAAVSKRWRRIVGALAGVGCVAVLTGVVVGPRANHDAPSPSTVTDAPAFALPPPALATSATETIPSVSIEALPDSKAVAPTRHAHVPTRASAAEPSSAAPSPAAAPSIPSATAGSSRVSLRREIELIAQARRALTGSDNRTCLAALDLHDSEFPTGQFALEAKVMRVEATLANGDRAGARALALDYLAKNPASPYDARVRSLLSSTGEQ
jgi:hypothetical protein